VPYAKLQAHGACAPQPLRSGALVVGCWLLVVGGWLLVVSCWVLVVGEIAEENACKFMRQRMLHVQVAQVAYFCVCRWFFSGWRLVPSGW
jgi:hypothetical protein